MAAPTASHEIPDDEMIAADVVEASQQVVLITAWLLFFLTKHMFFHFSCRVYSISAALASRLPMATRNVSRDVLWVLMKEGLRLGTSPVQVLGC